MMECVVHYSESNRTFTKLKALPENQHQKLLKAKPVRKKETSELNQHFSQCQTIPGSDNLDVNIHGVHLEPCYKNLLALLLHLENENCHKKVLKSLTDEKGIKALIPILGFFQKNVSNVILFVNAKMASF